MRFLILSVVILAAFYTAQGKTVEECEAEAKRCKQYVPAFATTGGLSRDGMVRLIRTTPLDDICRALKAFVQCGGAVIDDPECIVHESVTQYIPLREKLQKGIKFACDDNKEAIARAIPCVTTTQFFHKIDNCKRNNECNSDASWGCVSNAVKALCDAQTFNFFDANWRKFQANHPGCDLGGENLSRRKRSSCRLCCNGDYYCELYINTDPNRGNDCTKTCYGMVASGRERYTEVAYYYGMPRRGCMNLAYVRRECGGSY